MIKHLLFIFVVLIAACSVNAEKKTSQGLYAAYNQYTVLFVNNKTFTDSELNAIFSHVSPRYQNYLLNSREKTPDVLKHLINEYLDLPNNFSNEVSHFEKHSNGYSCLLINELTHDQQKVALYIKYVNAKQWLFDNVIIEFPAEDEKFLQELICDSMQLQQKRRKGGLSDCITALKRGGRMCSTGL